MRQHVEVRLSSRHLPGLLDGPFRRDDFKDLGGVLVIRLTLPDERIEALRDYYLKHRKGFFQISTWRKYDDGELDACRLLQLSFSAPVELSGELAGTVYDQPCVRCGIETRRSNPLKLDTTRLRRHSDIAMTLAGEIAISDSLATRLRSASLSGLSLAPVDCPGKAACGWWEPVATTESISIASPPSEFGIDYFDRDDAGRYRCHDCAIIGLSRLSILTIRGDLRSGDYFVSRERAGLHRGLIRPRPMIIVSQELRRAMAGARGHYFYEPVVVDGEGA